MSQDPNTPLDRQTGQWIGLGLVFGTGLGIVVGIFTDTLAIGIAIGAALGLIVGIALMLLTRNTPDDA